MALVAPAVPSASTDLDDAMDYRMAERIGSIEAWRAFLAAHSSGIYADGARAQLEKMRAGSKTPSTAGTETPSPSPAPGSQAASGSATSAVQQLPATETATLTEDENCRRDANRLAQLRSSPSGEDAQRFASELKCARNFCG